MSADFVLKNAKISNVEKKLSLVIVCPSQNFRNQSFDAWKLGMVGETGSSAASDTGWPRKHYPSLSQVAEILLIMTQIGHFATRFLTKSKEMGTIWTSRFEDKSLNFIARYF